MTKMNLAGFVSVLGEKQLVEDIGILRESEKYWLFSSEENICSHISVEVVSLVIRFTLGSGFKVKLNTRTD